MLLEKAEGHSSESSQLREFTSSLQPFLLIPKAPVPFLPFQLQLKAGPT